METHHAPRGPAVGMMPSCQVRAGRDCSIKTYGRAMTSANCRRSMVSGSFFTVNSARRTQVRSARRRWPLSRLELMTRAPAGEAGARHKAPPEGVRSKTSKSPDAPAVPRPASFATRPGPRASPERREEGSSADRQRLSLWAADQACSRHRLLSTPSPGRKRMLCHRASLGVTASHPSAQPTRRAAFRVERGSFAEDAKRVGVQTGSECPEAAQEAGTAKSVRLSTLMELPSESSPLQSRPGARESLGTVIFVDGS